MNDLYYQKYLKYKQKYIELQKLQQKIQSGGVWSIYIIEHLLKTPRNFDIFEGDEQKELEEYVKKKERKKNI
jgi:hypothetical protein